MRKRRGKVESDDKDCGLTKPANGHGERQWRATRTTRTTASEAFRMLHVCFDEGRANQTARWSIVNVDMDAVQKRASHMLIL